MILRKPYAILIKNFRLIHIIMAIFMGYLFYKTNQILNFFSEYLDEIATTISNEITASLFNSLLILSIFIVLVGSIVIIALLYFKQKPVKFYIYNIIVCIGISVYYIVAYYNIKTLETALVDIKTLKLLHDIALIVLILQGLGLVFVIMRATGFDIKSFNFKKDLEELDIEVNDNEEFEVNTEVDSNKYKRQFNKSIRHLKYVYLENKLLINILISVFVFIVAAFIFINTKIINKEYKVGEYFSTNQFMFNVENSYTTKYDYKYKTISDDMELVVIRLKAEALYQTTKLDIGRFYLTVGNNNYYHNVDHKTELSDIGITYNSQDINTDDYETYLLVFEIPKNKKNKEMTLNYADTDNDIKKINFKPISLDEKRIENDVSIDEELSFDNSPLKETKLKIDSFDINDTFEINYKYCVNNECYDSKEYLNVSTKSNYKMTILRLNGNLNLDEKLNINNISKLDNFIKYFGKIKYTINGEEKTMKASINTLKPNNNENNVYYIEIIDEVKSAEKIDIEFNIRNYIYTYHLK